MATGKQLRQPSWFRVRERERERGRGRKGGSVCNKASQFLGTITSFGRPKCAIQSYGCALVTKALASEHLATSLVTIMMFSWLD